MTTTEETYLTTGDAAQRLGITAQRVRQLIASNKLVSIKTAGGVSLIRASDVDELIAKRAGRPTKWHPMTKG